MMDMREARVTHIDIRVPPERFAEIRSLADKDHLPVSTWVRQKVLQIVDAALGSETQEPMS